MVADRGTAADFAVRLNSLLALRYRLLWAHVRSRNGRIALLVVAYFAAACLAVVFALGGVGTASAAVQMGRGELVAQLLLAGVFVNATFAAVFLGIGVTPAFSDSALRRYPLSSTGRLVARHATALLEPLWLLVLTLVTGLALGFGVSHGFSFQAVPAAVLFVVTNYGFACILMRLGSWVMSTRAGPLLIIAAGSGLLLVVPLAPALVARLATRADGSIPGLTALGLTPPFAAAAAMADAAPRSAWLGLALLAGWSVVLCALSVVVERLPLHSHTVAGALAKWDHPCDRIAAAFGPHMAPLAGKILRYYVRSPVRHNYFVVLPAIALLMHGRGTPEATFLFALGVAPALGFGSTIPIAMNLFGFDGRGLRRYFLLPIRAADAFRTVALAGLLPGALLVPVALVAWLAFAPIHTDWRMLTALVCAGFGGLLFLQAIGLWTTLLSPRAIPFRVAFGNRLSFAANALMFVTMGILFGLPRGADHAGVRDRGPRLVGRAVGSGRCRSLLRRHGGGRRNGLRRASRTHHRAAGRGNVNMASAIEIEHLSKQYGDLIAVADLSLNVPRGSFFGFLGPNGAGKSTTFGCLTGLLDATRGTMRLLGEPMDVDAVALKRRIGVMPETLGLFDQLYAHEFLAFQARMFGLDDRTTRQRVTELLEALELAGEGRKPLAEFSAGMRKRVAFAAAIIHGPELLFLDEPFESIDPAGAAMMKTWLQRIVTQGRTVFMTTHVLETVQRLCDRVAIVASPGRLLWEGDITSLAQDGALVVDGRAFPSLEELFLHLTGRRDAQLDWV